MAQINMILDEMEDTREARYDKSTPRTIPNGLFDFRSQYYEYEEENIENWNRG